MAADGATGMVAVVRGLQDAGLAVTLYDNGKEFTLAPNTFTQPQLMQNQNHNAVAPVVHMAPPAPPGVPHPHGIPHSHGIPYPHGIPHTHTHPVAPHYIPDRRLPYSEVKSTATNAKLPDVPSNNAGTQVVDGRYASVYQATYCKMKPSNPPADLPEFPPQRPDVSRGGGNFVVGGPGSGDTRHKHIHTPNHYRGGGLMWPDKESVCSPRPSAHLDSFAKSLRKYPRLSPERSSEIVERLITYTQAKNYGRSPSRQVSHDQCEATESIPKNPSKISRGCNACRILSEESPTRDRPRRGESEPLELQKNYYFKNCDVRHLRDLSKALKENMCSAASSNYQNYQQNHPGSPRHRSPNGRRSVPEQTPQSRWFADKLKPSPGLSQNVIIYWRTSDQDATGSHNFNLLTITSNCNENINLMVEVPSPNAEQATEQQEAPTTTQKIKSTHSTIEIPSGKLALNTRKSRSIEEIGNKHDEPNENPENLSKNTSKAEVDSSPTENKTSADLKIEISNDQSKTYFRNTTLQYRNSRAYRRKMSKAFSNMRFFDTTFDVFRADIITSKDYVIRTVKAWLANIPLKSHDFLGRVVKKDQILCYVVRRIKMIPTRIQLDKKKFRAEILDIVDDVPFDMGRGNRNIYLKKIAEDLITKLELARLTKVPFERYPSRKLSINKFVINTATNLKRYVRPSEKEIRDFVKKELINAIHKSNLDISSIKAKDVEDELVDVLNDTLEYVNMGRETEVMEEIVSTLEEIGQILRFQALYFATMLLNNFRKRFWNRPTSSNISNYIAFNDCGHVQDTSNTGNGPNNKRNYGTSNIQIAMVSKCCETYIDENISEKTSINTEQSLRNEYDLKTKMDLETYTSQLSKIIGEWLDTIENEIPQARSQTFRRIIIKELVDDIVDRQKYLKLNPTSVVSERDEVEHLRYQIFKWIYKLVGENSMVTLERAPTLMKIIRSVPVPDSIKRRKIWKDRCNSDQTKNQNMIRFESPVFTMTANQIPALGGIINSSVESNEGDQLDAVFTYTRRQNNPKPVTLAVQSSIGRINPGPSAVYPVQTLQPPGAKTVEEINNEFLEFVNQWINSMPIPPNTPQEQEIRQGFLQGLIQAIAKIKSSPVIALNPLYYEDALDDELEELFSLLPQTEELLAKKHQLKVQMITKNCYVNEKIKQLLAPDTFGQQVRNELSVYVPRTETHEREDDRVKLFEELKILFLAEEYIMYLRYREEDEVKANVYKMKLLRRIHEFVRDLKQIHGAELKDIDEKAYMDDILAAIEKVPLPSEETIRQEADEVMLGMEIDKWFSDLPLVRNDDVLEQLRRRRVRDQLAKKVYEIEKNSSLVDESGEMAIRHEVSQVLDKLPLEKDESLKINFMVDELTNRIKNRRGGPNGRKKNVGFDKSVSVCDNLCGKASDSSHTNVANQQPPLTGRWVNVPGTSIAVHEAQTMKDPSGRIWFTLDTSPTSVPKNQQLMQQDASAGPMMQPTPNQTFPRSQQGISFAGAAHSASNAPSQVMVQPGIPIQHPIPTSIPQTLAPPQAAATQCAPPQTFPPAQVLVPAHGSNRPLNTAVEDGNHSLWLNKYVQDYEAKHPSLTAVDTSINFGPPRSGVIHELSKFDTGQKPASSSMYQPKTAQDAQQTQGGSQSPKSQTSKRGSPSRSQRNNSPKPLIADENNDAGWPYSLGHPFGTAPRSPPNVSQKSRIDEQQKSSEQTFHTLEITKDPGNWSGRPVPKTPPVIPTYNPFEQHSVQEAAANSPGPKQNFVQQYIPRTKGIDQPVQVPQQGSPNQEAVGSMWLSKYLQEYEAAHPPIDSPHTSRLAPNNASIRPPPQNVSIMPPPEYGVFGQQRPLSSSLQQMSEQQKSPDPTFHTMEITKAPEIFSDKPISKKTTIVPAYNPFEQHSLQGAAGSSPPGMQGVAQPNMSRIQQGVGQPMQRAQPVAANTQDPSRPTDGMGSMWLNKYMQDYEAAHPPFDTPHTSQLPSEHGSIRPPPQNASVMPPPEYGMFGQERPASSSMHQQLEQTLGGPAFLRSVSAHRPQSHASSQASGRDVNISQPGSKVSETGGQRSIQSQTPVARPSPMQNQTPVPSQSPSKAIPVPVSSAGFQAPDFYKSTDREGIQRFTDQNKSANQQPSSGISAGIQAYQSPGVPQGAQTVTAQTSQIPQAPEPKQTSGVWSYQDQGQSAAGSYVPLRQPIGYSTPEPGTVPDQIGAPRKPIPQRIGDADTGDESDGRYPTLTELQSKYSEKVRENPDFTEKSDHIFVIPREIKSVQTAFSAMDIPREVIATPNNINIKSKSQDNINTIQERTEDELCEWLKDLQLKQKGKSWSDKLQKLAEALQKPGGEEKLKHKIKKFLQRFPSNFDNDDEEGQRFREQLPDYIVNKLKNTFPKQEKRSKSPIGKKLKGPITLKTIVKAWIKILPVMKKDFLGKPIRKDEILESMIHKLEPFISHRPESDIEFENMLLSYVTEIANGIPLAYDMKKEKEYMTSIVNELVENILEHERQNFKRRKPKVIKSGSMQNIYDIKGNKTITEELENFIADEIVFQLKDSDVPIRKNIITFIEQEIVNIFSDAVQSLGAYKSDDMKLDICNLLHEVGNLPQYQAEYFSNELVKNFKYIFLNNIHKTNKRFGGAYSEVCLVYNVSHVNFTQPRRAVSDKPGNTNMEAYAKEISSYIDHWLCTYRIHLPLIQHQAFREAAVSELTESIINRHQYIKQHSASRETTYDEHEHMKYLIFKWIRKLVGEDNIEIIQHVPELLLNILKVITLPCPERKIECSKSDTVASTSTAVYEQKQIKEVTDDLYEEILDWYSDLPRCLYIIQDRKAKRNHINQLADTIAKGLNTSECIGEFIDKEVNAWMKKVLKRLPRSLIIEELKARIKIVCIEKTQIKTDASSQAGTDTNSIGTKTDLNFREDTPVDFTMQLINEIEEWLTGMHLSIKDTTQEAIKNLALDIVDRHKYLELNPILRGSEKDELENLKYQIYKWLNKVISENNMEPVTRASQLMQRLQNIIPRTKQTTFTVSCEEQRINYCRENESQKNLCHCSKYKRSTSPAKKCDGYSNTEIISKTVRTAETNYHDRGNKRNNYLHKSSSTDVKPEFSSRAVGGNGRSFAERHGLLVGPSLNSPLRKFRYLTQSTHNSSVCNEITKNLYFSSGQQTSTQNTEQPKWQPDSIYPYYCNNYSTFTINSYHKKRYTDNAKECRDAGTETDNYNLELAASSAINKIKPETARNTKSSLFVIKGPQWHSSFVEESPVGMSLSQTYEYFDQIFRKRCDQIPIDESSPDLISLGECTKAEIHKVIWKTYFKIKEDPSIEKNYTLLVAILEDQLDTLLDYLPQTEEFIQFRPRWKNKVVRDVLRMLDYVHSINATTSYKQQLTEKFKIQFLGVYNSAFPNPILCLLTSKIVDAYILYTKYKIANPTKVNIYNQRLRLQIAELFQYIKDENKQFRLEPDQYLQDALSLLSTLPLPDIETLEDEADEILMGDVIEQWYNELQVTYGQNKPDDLLRHSVRKTLGRKLLDIEKMNKIDQNKMNAEMLLETAEYLEREGFTNSTQDALVKAKELVNKLNNKKLNDEIIKFNENSIEEACLEQFETFNQEISTGLLESAGSSYYNKDRARAGKSGPDFKTCPPLRTPHQIFLTNVQKSANVIKQGIQPNFNECRQTSANPAVDRKSFFTNPREFGPVNLSLCPLLSENTEFKDSDLNNSQEVSPSDHNNRSIVSIQTDGECDIQYDHAQSYMHFQEANPQAFWYGPNSYMMPFLSPPY